MSKLGLIALSFFVLAGFIVSSSFAQGNQTNINETGGMMGNQINQTGGNQTQQGPLEQLGETLGGIIGGGNQSQ
jgi:hypothetical protein